MLLRRYEAGHRPQLLPQPGDDAHEKKLENVRLFPELYDFSEVDQESTTTIPKPE